MSKLDLTFDPISRKNTGSHYTPSVLAQFVAKNIFDQLPEGVRAKTLRILDPSVGDGELLYAAATEAQKRGYKFDLTAFDINSDALAATKSLIKSAFPRVNLNLHHDDFLQYALKKKGSNSFDVIIANPPYVRTQVMGSVKAKAIAESFELSGRVDLYHAFIKGIEKILELKGIVGIIVSNRFMTIKSGEAVRKHIVDNFQINHVWDFGDTRLFDAAVLPAVLILSKETNRTNKSTFASVYLSGNKAPLDHSSVFEALNGIEDKSLKVQRGLLNTGETAGSTWRLSTEYSDKWLQKVHANTRFRFGDLGKIRVGIKTTADSIFILSQPDLLFDGKPEMLRPLITHHIARRYRAPEPVRHIVYTHEIRAGRKQPIDLTRYPITAKYLETHREELSKRTYVAESGRNWFEIWVPQDPSQWERPKMVFRDISDKPTFWLDKSGAIVNGDCYWMTLDSDKNENLLWLALAVANSKFIEDFYDHSFNNKLYSGRRRFITQYVEKFPIPNPEKRESKKAIAYAKQLYKLSIGENPDGIEKKINDLVYSAFNL